MSSFSEIGSAVNEALNATVIAVALQRSLNVAGLQSVLDLRVQFGLAPPMGSALERVTTLRGPVLPLFSIGFSPHLCDTWVKLQGGNAMKKTKKTTRPKKTSRKKIGSKKTSPKRTRRIPKKRVITDRKESVLAKIKDAFDDTAAKIKTLLPGEPETPAKEPDQPEREIR
jgi:hypothetical protein